MVVRARAQEHRVTFGVDLGAVAEVVDDFRLRHLARHFYVARQAVLGGNRREQFVDGLNTDLAQHLLAIGRRFR